MRQVVIGHLSVIRDITGRIRAEEAIAAANLALVRRERQFSTLVENSPDIFARFDRDLRLLYVSPVAERYTGIAAAAHIGRTNRELGMPAEVSASWDAALREVFETGEVGRIKFNLMTVTGDEKIFDARLVPEFGEDGSVESVLSLASDTTEQEWADAALRDSQGRLKDADRRKDEFLATLAHELRNPLAPIRNALQIMRLTNEPVIHENARSIIERQLQQMVHLVDDLLDVSRISQGRSSCGANRWTWRVSCRPRWKQVAR